MKRFICMVLAVLFCFGCGRDEKRGERPIKIRFWHILGYSGPREVLEGAIARFEAENPDCEIVNESFENDAYKVKLAVELAGGNLPDVFFTWGGGHLAEMVKNGRALELDSRLGADFREKSVFIPAALDLCSSDGRLYALPLDLSAVMLWCNPRIFRECGLSYPREWEELLSACREFRRRGIHPIALGNKPQWTGAFFFCYLANRIGGTELFMRGCLDSQVFAGDEFVRAGKGIRRLMECQAFPTGFNGMDDAQARAAFVNGRAAMYLMGSWVVARVKTERPDFVDEMTPIPFPAVPGGKGDGSTLLAGINAGFAVSSACPHPDKAVAFLKCLTDQQVVSEWCATGRIPAMKTTPEQEAALPAPSRKVLQALREAKSLQPYYDQYLAPRMAVLHKETTQKIFAGTMTPEEAAAAMGKGAKE